MLANDNTNMKVFSLNSNIPLAEEVVKHIGIDLGKSTITRFSDGEIQMNIEESIRGCDIYLIQSTAQPGNDYIMELLIMIDALKRASAKTINCVIPYFGYSRQDRKARSREPVTAKLIANLLEKAGASRIITVDLHSPQVQGFFNVPVDQLLAFPLLSKYFIDKALDDVVVVAPENNGVVRARKLADALDSSIAFIDRNRRPKTYIPGGMEIMGDVSGKTAIIIDDMVDTARTVTTASNALIERGAKEVYACCTHPVLSEPASTWIEESPIKELVTTNSIHLPDERRIDKITTLSIAPLLGEAIIKVQNNRSVSTLFK
ncbi:ribose-phosphate diphosphokinase [Evansella cellulosilytica]|uniref:Putative ribose-phosphate pyrophosphokinase n=1 Tax=Evansella cellulosilytica (strain ATCC 21833 / DSM 2522 / FERM P-1141 / JCM 9156 / N-4) TaxID=649639 RepID=E6TQP4_EVAC2|nr:ribose-phosphate pyrophosphokinase [Evansella cellulosilytica]ADU30555.1 ribose-phosphate pyrophosphokinase [Evansella cellulosilytica DSM 2522]